MLISLLLAAVTLAQAQFDISSCGFSKNCVFHPKGCELDDINKCIQGMSFRSNPSSDFYLDVEQFASNFKTNQGVYIAVAFKAKSDELGDPIMANTSVIECSSLGKEPVTGKVSFNNDDPRNVRISGEEKFRDQIVTNFNTVFHEGQLYCKYTQKIKKLDATYPPQVFRHDDLAVYQVLMAAGPTSSTGLKVHFDNSYIYTPEAFDLERVDDKPCPCVPRNIWHDIVLLIDGSSDMPQTTYDKLAKFAQTSLNGLTVGQSTTASVSRIGVIVSGASATVLANLTTLPDNKQFMNLKIQKINTPSNIRFGVQAAVNMLNDPKQHRPNTKKVIVLVGEETSPYIYGTGAHPLDDFKNSGGLVITISNTHTLEMMQLASPTYWMSLQTGTSAQFMEMLCDANCFCPNGYSPITSLPRSIPNEGCFVAPKTQVTRSQAGIECSKLRGSPIIAKDTPQRTFAVSNVDPNVIVHIGLKKNTNGRWMWDDGSDLDMTENSVEGTGQCGFIYRPSGFKTAFVAGSCDDKKNFACQANPCSSHNYCK